MAQLWKLLGPATWETIYMVAASTLFALILELPISVLLILTRKDGLSPNNGVFAVLDGIINVLRSFPFIILMIIVLPVAKVIVGTSVGTTAVIVPLSISAAPFVARVMEQAFLEVDRGIIEAAKAMGSNNSQIITRVLIPEAMPSMISGLTMTIINVIGYSAMAGTIGGGGLGNLAIRYGYHRYETEILFAAVIVIIILVAVVQFVGSRLSSGINKK